MTTPRPAATTSDRPAATTPAAVTPDPPAPTAPYRPAASHHRREALFVRALLRGEYDRAVLELRTAIFLRGLVGTVIHGGLDEGHALFIRHLEGELDSLLALTEAGRPHWYRISSGIFNSVKKLMYVPPWIRR